MNVITYSAFKNEMSKIAWHGAAEIAGLSMLAAPTVQKMRGKPMSEKGTHAAELGGLGVLAAPAAHSIYSGAKKAVGELGASATRGGKIRAALGSIAKHGSVSLADGALSLFKEADADLWNPHTGDLSQMSNKFNRTVSGGSAAAAAKKPAFTLAHLQAAKAKLPGAGAYQGIKRGLGAVASHVR